LHEAAKWSRPEIVQLLLDAGSNIETRNSNQRSALDELAAITNSARQYGETNYHDYAVSERRFDVARILIDAAGEIAGSSDLLSAAADRARQSGDAELARLFSGEK
jgi:ankyrin repeat protein